MLLCCNELYCSNTHVNGLVVAGRVLLVHRLGEDPCLLVVLYGVQHYGVEEKTQQLTYRKCLLILFHFTMMLAFVMQIEPLIKMYYFKSYFGLSSRLLPQ